jgi:hypothetical protein
MLTRFLKKDHFPLILLILCSLAYGIFIPFLGFYWDDFPYMWFKHTTGILGVIKAIALDRPVLGVFYAIPMTVLGQTTWVWQVFAIFCRWIFILSVFQFLNKVFSENIQQNKLIIILFSVFPGFSQQWISVIYSHAFLIFALYFFSLSLFIDQVYQENNHWSKFVLPISLSILSLLATEYMAGMEVLRPLIIYKIISSKYPEEPISEKLKRTVKTWGPYLAAMIFFIFYRIFIASSVLYKVQKLDNLSANPLATIINLIQVQFINIYTSTILVWSQIIQPLLALNLSSLITKIYLLITIGVFFITLVFLNRKKSILPQNPEKSKKWFFELLIGSFISLFFVGIPFWAANLRPDLHFPNDRIFIPFMLGSCSMIFLLIWILKKKWFIFSLLFSVIFSLSLSYQVYQANSYRVEWTYFKQFFQQLSWRVPSLEKNTILVTDELPLKYYSDNSLTAAFNWLYSEKIDNNQIPYLINFTKARLGKSLPSLERGTKLSSSYRIFNFQGSTDQLILFYHNPPGCVHLADPDLDIYNPLIQKDIRKAAALSRLDLINNEEKKNPVFFIKNGPESSWCYYYQKASLAVQNRDWIEAARLGDIAFTLNDYPNDASERLPFIEAYAMVGKWQKAIDLSNLTIQISDLYKPIVCKLWERINQNSMDNTNSIFHNKSEFLSSNCNN